MADGPSFDFSEIDRLAADFGKVNPAIAEGLKTALERTARNVKDVWRDKLAGSEHLPRLPYAVSYDIRNIRAVTGSDLTAEIGFDKSRTQGPLGTISEYGTPRTPGRGYGLAALQENLPDFQHGIDEAINDGLKAAGL